MRSLISAGGHGALPVTGTDSLVATLSALLADSPCRQALSCAPVRSRERPVLLARNNTLAAASVKRCGRCAYPHTSASYFSGPRDGATQFGCCQFSERPALCLSCYERPLGRSP